MVKPSTRTSSGSSSTTAWLPNGRSARTSARQAARERAGRAAGGGAVGAGGRAARDGGAAGGGQGPRAPRREGGRDRVWVCDAGGAGGERVGDVGMRRRSRLNSKTMN